MIKSLALCIISLGLTYYGIAQSTMNASNSNKGLLSLTLGPSFPIGAFASKDPNSSTSGLANIGGSADLSYRHPFKHSRFGWMASVTGNINWVNKNATLEPLEAEFSDYQWTQKNNYWSDVSALVGAYYTIGLRPKLSLELALELGAAKAWSPNQSIRGLRDSSGQEDLVLATVHPISAYTFTGKLSAGIRYQLRSHLALLGGINFTYLKPTFNNLRTDIYYAQDIVISGNYQLSNSGTVVAENSHWGNYTQAMDHIDLSVGIGWKL
jgi:hypothetical protein